MKSILLTAVGSICLILAYIVDLIVLILVGSFGFTLLLFLHFNQQFPEGLEIFQHFGTAGRERILSAASARTGGKQMLLNQRSGFGRGPYRAPQH